MFVRKKKNKEKFKVRRKKRSHVGLWRRHLQIKCILTRRAEAKGSEIRVVGGCR